MMGWMIALGITATAAGAGDPALGKSVFESGGTVACVLCHKVGGIGGEVGPDLSEVGGKLDREALAEAIREPSRQIVEGYRTSVLALEDGRIVQGLVRGESEEEVTLVDLEGKAKTYRLAEVEERGESSSSLMPDTLASGLSESEFADLLAYLESLRASGQGSPGSGVAGPVGLPPGFRRETVAEGLTAVTAMAVAPDGRVFVCEQGGTLRVVKDDRLLPEPVLQVEVDSLWERGLIGVAVDPDFARNGFFYVCYVARTPFTHHRIARFTMEGDRVLPGSERILLRGDDQAGLGGKVPAGHQGGGLRFGRDGMLYVGIGEQTAGTPSQRLDTFQGKLLRIAPDGSIPADNPFRDEAEGKYRAIWAKGLRNPFSFAVQPGTGRIFVNDVGETRWEEVNEAVEGGDYGWPQAEGPSDDPRFVGPIHSYPAASIAGAAFCPEGESSGFPASYRGMYFFADFVRGWIKVLDPDDPGEASTFATGFARPVGLEFAPVGGLYVLLRDAWVNDGEVRPGTGSLQKIVFEGAEEARRPRAQGPSGSEPASTGVSSALPQSDQPR